VANAPPELQDELRTDCLLAMQEAATAGNISRARSRSNLWKIWCKFCLSLNLHDLLAETQDPIPLLQVFARRYRDGRIERYRDRGRLHCDGVRARTVEDAVRQIGKTFVELGALNPRLDVFGQVDARLSAQIKQWKQEDPPPKRVKPIPISILHQVFTIAAAAATLTDTTVANLVYLAFFFLCRPGEYTAASEGSRPFRFCDTALFLGTRKLDLRTASETEIMNATFATLTFTNQKNCHPGEVVGQACSGSTTACPVRSIGRLILHLRANDCPDDTPLCAFKEAGTWRTVTNTLVTEALRRATCLIGHQYGITPSEISARSLRASGAMAMLCAHIDPMRTKLLGRWNSDSMLDYLTMQAYPMCADLAPRMLTNGDYSLLPGQTILEAVAAFDEELQSQQQADAVAAATAVAAAINPNAP